MKSNFILISDAKFVGVHPVGAIVGQFTTKSKLFDAVDYFMNKESNKLLHWERYELNKFPADLIDWGYGYIPYIDKDRLSKFDDAVPHQMFTGINLIGIDYQKYTVTTKRKLDRCRSRNIDLSTFFRDSV